MYISSGSVKGKRIKAIANRETRPTAQLIKEALFDILGSRIEDSLFLDLFAGFGTVGIEALSRGAQMALFVDRSRTAIENITDNLRQLSFSDRGKILCAEVLPAIKKRIKGSYNIIFADPPYDFKFYDQLVALLAESHLMQEDSLFILEHYHKTTISDPSLERFRIEKYGQSVLSFFRKVNGVT